MGPEQEEQPLFFHWEFHPRGIPRKTIRAAFDRILAPLLNQAPLGIERMTIAYTNPPSIRQCLTKTQLREPQGKQASDYVEQVEQP